MRLLVTGHSSDGRATVASDGVVDPIVLPSGVMLHLLWGRDEAPKFPDEGRASDYDAYFPPPGGFRFSLFTVPPAGDGPKPAPRGTPPSDIARYVQPGGVHVTPSVDCGVVLSGEVWLELEDGAEQQLRAGDAFVQNGTRHVWRNHGPEPAVLALFVAGAHHAGVPDG
jgi:mannose-6-phosphate isomerase-like protein (cupin superfamily)